ncbi:hypothetical protein B9Z55_027740 [Caenorhabditis nigoni]|uniref:F-box domain-containing protein n=1 Tax=Caenorhabditis nigoni TaxID=1611254 RepID=A0A2G5SEL9_9PELO|nr:hypothetical protein B9Z55_027740 [Caenorhabditis nigoni]
MPELVMENIIKFSDFKSVLTLRQVSKDFLNFIDSLNDSTLPDSEFSRIDMIVNEDICLRYRDSNNIQNEFIYSQMDILRSFNGKITFLGSSSVIDVAIRDLELVLKFQKSNLRLLHFHLGPSFETFPVKLSNMFKKLNRKIKTENLSMKADSQSKIMPILPFVEPRTLERIDLLTLNDNMEIEINEIILIDSSKLSGIWLRLKNFNEHRELSNLWGPCFIGENSRLWYFRMKNSEEEIMEFELRRNSGNFTWRIKIIHIGGVPNGAAVHDYEEN